MKYSRSVIAALLLAVIAGTSAHSGDITPPGLLPADNEISGWKLDGEPLIYVRRTYGSISTARPRRF
jgi:hypothetical protein